MNRTDNAVLAGLTWTATTIIAIISAVLVIMPTNQSPAAAMSTIPTITAVATCTRADGGDQADYPCVWDQGPAATPEYLVYYRGSTCPVRVTDTVACLPAPGD